MPNNKKILKIAKTVISKELEAISQLERRLSDSFSTSVELILKSNGKVIVVGVGKSANIANKIVATLNSTGQPSVFLHAGDALHGDLGIIQENDIIICISNSGNTDELKSFVRVIKDLGNKIISICGNNNSFLSRNSDFFIDSTVDKEACPNNLAPTSSTTAQLVLGDAISVCLLKLRNFTNNDFAKLHPAGLLGKQLSLKVSDIVIESSLAKVFSTDPISKVIFEISNKRVGATAVLDDDEIVGIITDGDLRRMLEKNKDIDTLRASDVMCLTPKIICSNRLVTEALAIMKNNNISQLLVVENNDYIGIIHIHDILKEGIK